MVDVPTTVQFNALSVRVSNLEALSGSLGTRVTTLENNQKTLPPPSGSQPFSLAPPSADPSPTPMPTWLTVTPQRNADFLAIWAVDGNISGNSGVYLDAASVPADAAYVGARRFRESLAATGVGQMAVLRALVASGIGLIGYPPTVNGSTTTLVLANVLAAAKSWAGLAPGALSLLSGVDDAFYAPISYGSVVGGGTDNGPWTSVAQFQSDWHDAVAGDLVTAGIPVATGTRVGQQVPNCGLQFAKIPVGTGATFADGTFYADALGMFLYPVIYSQASQTVDENGDHILQQLRWDFVTTQRNGYVGYSDAQAMTLTRHILEFGLSTTAGSLHLTEDIKGKNLLTGLFNANHAAYRTVAIHELYETGDGYGLFSAKGNPNTSAVYLHNAAVVLNDPGAGARTFLPTAILVGLTTLPTTALWDLFQKADGHYQLAIWNNATNWSGSSPLAINGTSITVTFPALGTVRVFDPTLGFAAASTTNNVASASVSLTDHPIIVDWIQTSV